MNLIAPYLCACVPPAQLSSSGAWKEIAQIVVTRNATQVQSHAQKYFMRQKQEKRNKRSIHDLSVDDITEMSVRTHPPTPYTTHPHTRHIHTFKCCVCVWAAEEL